MIVSTIIVYPKSYLVSLIQREKNKTSGEKVDFLRELFFKENIQPWK